MTKAINKAIILAAGIGSRLKEMGENMPKGFIQLDKTSIIEHSLKTLLSLGIKEVMIVTGHKFEFYEKLKETYPEIRTTKNTRFYETGTMCSLRCARDFVDADFILLESDLIYDPVGVTELLNVPYKDCLLLSGTTNAGDEVYVEVDENRLTAISKNRDHIKNSAGEYVGISKISKQLYDKLLHVADPELKLSYDMDCMAHIAKEHPIYFLRMEGLHWAEIDNLAQLDRAQKVWEKIKSKKQ